MKKNWFLTCNIKINFFFQKWSNLHERSGFGWIEIKTKFGFFWFLFFELCSKTLKQAILWTLLSANLFRLESSIQKNVGCGGGEVPQKKNNYFLLKILFLFKILIFQIYMKVQESAAYKEDPNFRFLFFRVIVILWPHHPNFQWIFHNSKNKNWRIFFPYFTAHSHHP